jgi:hypothetical protein
MAAAPPTARRSRWLLTRDDWVGIRWLLAFAACVLFFLFAFVTIQQPHEVIGGALWPEDRMTALAHEAAAGFDEVLIPVRAGEPPAAEGKEGGLVLVCLRADREREAQAVCEAFREEMLRRDPAVLDGFVVVVVGPDPITEVTSAEMDYRGPPEYARCGGAWWAWWQRR